MKAFTVLVTLLAALGLASCVVAPASIRRVARDIERLDDRPAQLHALLGKALSHPEDPKAAQWLGQFVELWKRRKMPASADLASGGTDPGEVIYRVTFPAPPARSSESYSLDYFDELKAGADHEVVHLYHHRRPGVGAPLVALRENKNREPLERFYPPEVIARPVTAVATAGPRQGRIQPVTVQLLSPLALDTVVYRGRRQPLAADFSISWGAALSRTGNLNRAGFWDMLTSNPTRKPQLFLMEPYDPDKEPLIMIHGLLSTPLAWAGLCNQFWADDQLRSRYQIWHYLYNTSAPALFSGRILRTQLGELRQILDPDGNDPAMQHTTVLAHSMGGLIAKSLVVRPGDLYWKAAFRVSPDHLQLSAEDRVMLNDAFEWQPDPRIHRIIYVAVPHRGSAFADNVIGRLGGLLTAPPQTFRGFYERISKDNVNVFTPEYEALGRGRLNSVQALSPRQPTLRILAGLPYAYDVTVHSIIGNRGSKGPLAKSSDGVVPYASSHLEGAESELIVPTGHGAFVHPRAVAEIERILKLPR